MERSRRSDRWANTFSWAVVALTVWTANWWISLLIPVTPIAVFLTTIIAVSLVYALALAVMQFFVGKEVQAWSFLPRRVRNSGATAIALALAGLILLQNIRDHRSLSFDLTTMLATAVGLGIASWWRPLLEVARGRMVRYIHEFSDNVRGRLR